MVSAGKDRSSKSLVFYPLFFLLLVFGAILRLTNFDFFFTDFFGHYNFFDPDSYYQLRRLAFFLQNFPESLTFDPLLAWPSGDLAHWPKLSLWLYGFWLWLFGVDSYQALELGASYLSILYGLVLCGLIYFAARRILDQSFSILVLFLAVLNPFLIRFSCLGQVDHHIFELLLVPIALLLGLKSLSSAKTAFLLGVVFALSFGISSSVLFVIGAVMLSFALVDFSRDKRKEFLSLIFGFILIFPLVMLWHQDVWRQNFDIRMPSFFQAFAVLSLFFLVAPFILFKKNRIKLISYLTMGVFGGLLYAFTPMQGLFLTAFRYVFGRQGILAHVLEARPLFYGVSDFQFDFIINSLGYFFPISLALFLLPFFWRRLATAERFYFIMALILFIPALAQRRFIIYFIALFFILIVWALKFFIQYLKEKSIRVHYFVIPGFVLMAIFPGIEFGFAPDMDPRLRVDFSILHMTKDNLDFDSKIAWKRLGEKSPEVGGIWTNPNLGHLLTYISGMGSLVDPFYITPSLRKDLKGRKIEQESDFFNFLDENKIDLVFLLNDFHYFRMLHEVFREDMPWLRRAGPSNAYVFDLQILEPYFWVRSILRPDTEWEAFEEILRIQVMENHFYNFVRLMQRKKIAP